MVGNFSPWHLLILLLAVAAVVLFIGAIVSITKAQQASGTERAVWILIVIIAPLLGSIIWFAVGRSRGGSFG